MDQMKGRFQFGDGLFSWRREASALKASPSKHNPHPRHETQVRACRTRTGDVVFNRNLAAESPRAIEYLVLHVLAHLIEPSHGPRFQAILAEHMSDWRAV